VTSIKIKDSLKKEVKTITKKKAHLNNYISHNKKRSHTSKNNKISPKNNKPSKKELFFFNVRRNVGSKLCFILSNGNNLYSLKELSLELDNMSDEVFNFHVNDSKNDFHNWVRDVIKDEELSIIIEKVKNAKDMQIRILKHIVKEL
jgi:hypothetical protein